MALTKQLKDHLIKILLGKEAVPSGLAELSNYFRFYGPIYFQFETQEDGSIIAISKNFRCGSIVSQAKDKDHLDEKVKDAILTAFEVPSSYAKEAHVCRTDEKGYAFA